MNMMKEGRTPQYPEKPLTAICQVVFFVVVVFCLAGFLFGYFFVLFYFEFFLPFCFLFWFLFCFILFILLFWGGGGVLLLLRGFCLSEDFLLHGINKNISYILNCKKVS